MEKAVELEPLNSEYLVDLAISHDSGGHIQEATAKFEQAVQVVNERMASMIRETGGRAVSLRSQWYANAFY